MVTEACNPIRVRLQDSNHPLQRLWREEIIRVEKYDERSATLRESVISSSAHPDIVR
jgi:hypothetical protein